MNERGKLLSISLLTLCQRSIRRKLIDLHAQTLQVPLCADIVVRAEQRNRILLHRNIEAIYIFPSIYITELPFISELVSIVSICSDLNLYYTAVN